MAEAIAAFAKGSKVWKNLSRLDSGPGGGQRDEEEKGGAELHRDETEC
jgi:hypothetical protein